MTTSCSISGLQVSNSITPKDAFEKSKLGEAVLVDVREKEELEESGRADGALWCATSSIVNATPESKKFIADLPKDKLIIAYCRSGGRSGKFVEILKQQGYRAVNMGGFSSWVAAGLPVSSTS